MWIYVHVYVHIIYIYIIYIFQLQRIFISYNIVQCMCIYIYILCIEWYVASKMWWSTHCISSSLWLYFMYLCVFKVKVTRNIQTYNYIDLFLHTLCSCQRTNTHPYLLQRSNPPARGWFIHTPKTYGMDPFAIFKKMVHKSYSDIYPDIDVPWMNAYAMGECGDAGPVCV